MPAVDRPYRTAPQQQRPASSHCRPLPQLCTVPAHLRLPPPGAPPPGSCAAPQTRQTSRGRPSRLQVGACVSTSKTAVSQLGKTEGSSSSSDIQGNATSPAGIGTPRGWPHQSGSGEPAGASCGWHLHAASPHVPAATRPATQPEPPHTGEHHWLARLGLRHSVKVCCILRFPAQQEERGWHVSAQRMWGERREPAHHRRLHTLLID